MKIVKTRDSVHFKLVLGPQCGLLMNFSQSFPDNLYFRVIFTNIKFMESLKLIRLRYEIVLNNQIFKLKCVINVYLITNIIGNVFNHKENCSI